MSQRDREPENIRCIQFQHQIAPILRKGNQVTLWDTKNYNIHAQGLNIDNILDSIHTKTARL